MQCCCCGSQDVPCLISSFSTQRCAWLSSADQSSANITAFLFVCLPFFLSHKTQSLDAAQTPVLSRWKNIWGMSPGPSFHLFLSLANLNQSVWKMWWLLLKKMILYLTSHTLQITTPEARASVVQMWQGGWRCSASGVSFCLRVWFLVQPAKTAREPLQDFNFCTKANLHLSGNL